jgi:hypothetical protein
VNYLDRIDKHGERHVVPAIAWIASFGLCVLGDVMLGRWVLLPLFVVGFYGGTIIIALVTYPMLSSWRGWLKRRGLIAWYLVEVGGLWSATMLVLFLLSPWWLRWSWSGMSSLQVLGCVLFVGSGGGNVGGGRWDGRGCCSPGPYSFRVQGPRRTAFRNAWWRGHSGTCVTPSTRKTSA